MRTRKSPFSESPPEKYCAAIAIKLSNSAHLKIDRGPRLLRHAQFAFPNDALVRLGRMFDPVMKLAAGSWKPLRHHVSSRSWIDCSTCGGMKLHVVTDREPVGHCLDP